jgi:hypothetical protein
MRTNEFSKILGHKTNTYTTCCIPYFYTLAMISQKMKMILSNSIISQSGTSEEDKIAVHLWLTPVILATQEAEIRRIVV